MRALLLILIASTALGQGRFDRFNQRTDQGRSTRGFEQSSYAFFEFAPASGAGMGTACACTTPTGAKGEALTFTRAGDATCSKQGLATTGIANGDLVVCTANQPRVESSGGVLGLRVEGARTNEALRSSDWANAVWVGASGGVAAPTITADQAVAPDGTTTADRIQVPATTSGQYSYIYQSGFSSVQRTTSFFVKGNGSSGSINLLSGTTPNACVSCAYVADSWTRCSLPSSTTASTFFFVGNDSLSAVCTTSSKGAIDAFVWGAQHETGLFATSYIPTVAAAVTRNAERVYFARSVATTAGVCSAATQEVPSTTVYPAGSGLFAPLLSQLSGSAGSPYVWPYTSGTGTGLSIDGNGSSGAPSGWAPGTSNTSTFARYVAGHDGTAWRICKDAACSSNGVASAWSSPTYQFIKFDTVATNPEAAIWTRVQVDPSFSRCTP